MKGKGKKKQKNPSNVFSMFEKSQARFHFETEIDGRLDWNGYAFSSLDP